MGTECYNWVQLMVQNSRSSSERLGQYMFNRLPTGAAVAITGTLFDPFHKNFEIYEAHRWAEEHLIFDGNEVVGVFNGNQLLWEKDDGN